jgi:hypothetical protein
MDVVVVGAALHLGLMPSIKYATRRVISPLTAGLAMMLISWIQIGT